MKNFITVLILFLLSDKILAQEKHFVFIQSDNQQPFYASVNGKIYSSSSTGYVIIPKLADGNYSVIIGFAKNTAPEQSFAINVNQKDLGYNLKNFGEKGFGLFNLQTLDVTMAATGNEGVASGSALKNNADDDIISFPARKKDTAVARLDTKPSKKKAAAEPVVKIEQTAVAATGKDSVAIAKADVNADSLPKAESSNPQQGTVNTRSSETIAVTKDTAITRADPGSTATASSSKTESPLETVATTQPTAPASDIKKVSEKKSDEGVFLSFVDSNGKKTDTVQVIIPTTKSSAPSSSANASTDATNTPATTEPSSKPADNLSKKDEPKFLDVNMNTGKKDSVRVLPRQEEAVAIMPNSNCKNIASEEDYARLRKKMAQETSDEKMIAEAKKYYRDKCFTTEQVKRLSTLFLSDEGRLNFFNASFLSVADSPQYPTLQSEFIDPAFVTRFKALFQ